MNSIVTLLPFLFWFVPTIRLYLTSSEVTGMWTVLLSASIVQVHESWERGHSDQADIWQVHPDTSICQISIRGNCVTVE